MVKRDKKARNSKLITTDNDDIIFSRCLQPQRSNSTRRVTKSEVVFMKRGVSKLGPVAWAVNTS